MAAEACPNCGNGTLYLAVQVIVTTPVGSTNWDPDKPTTDDFVELYCDNCSMGLSQEPGDGRLRNAGLTQSGEFLDESHPRYDFLRGAFMDIAERLLTP